MLLYKLNKIFMTHLQSCDAVNEDYQGVVVICRDTDVILLVHFLFRIAKEVWMISGTATSRKCFPIHIAAERLTQPVRENLLSFYELAGRDTTSAFRGFGRKSCTFIKQPLLMQEVERDGDLDLIEKFVCQLCGVPYKSNVNDTRMKLFGKGKNSLDMLPPTRDALDLHTVRANYQAKIWLLLLLLNLYSAHHMLTLWTPGAG